MIRRLGLFALIAMVVVACGQTDDVEPDELTASYGDPITAVVNTDAIDRELDVEGGTAPYEFEITEGALPAGVALDEDSGALAGTPTETGDFTGTVTVTDDAGETAEADFDISVDAADDGGALTATAYGTVVETVDEPIGDLTPTVTGGATPYSYAVTAGALPAGVTLDATTGTISGTPTETGNFTGTVTVTDDEGATADAAFDITVEAADAGLVAADYTTVTETEGEAIADLTASATGGTTPYSYAVTAGALPAGVTLDATTGTISGTPTETGNFTGTVTVTDDAGATADAAFDITVNPDFDAGSFGVMEAVEGDDFVTYYDFANPSFTYGDTLADGSSLPAGITWDGNSGGFIGTPTETGVFDGAAIIENDVGESDDAPYRLLVSDATFEYVPADATVAVGEAIPAMNPDVSAFAGVPTAYSLGAETGVDAPLPFLGLPDGVTLDPTSGIISGTPTEAGFFRALIQVETDTGETGYTAVEIEVTEDGTVTPVG